MGIADWFYRLGATDVWISEGGGSSRGMMTYLEIPFAYVLQYFIFDDAITPLKVAGMLLIVASGFLNVLEPKLCCARKSRAKPDIKEDGTLELIAADAKSDTTTAG